MVAADTLPHDAGPLLLQLARQAIAARFGADEPVDASAPWLAAPGASFVTVEIHHRLRGCIGTLEAYRPLGEDVVGNAVAAAFDDPRFEPLTAVEYPLIHVEVSVLSAPEPLQVGDESEALGRLRPGIDGVVLSYGNHRATYLPQVWDQLPDPEEFLARLKMKAGLPATFWDKGIHLSRYTVKSWKEGESS